ncbi:MAG: hypothetical protein JKX84_03875 [Flavobacteriales bacterium]|nr:hypothetical protein [Flavobacteriales bacterium]
MKVSLEITLYPLTDGYKESVKDFLRKLNTYDDIEVITNGISTQVFGEYDLVMTAYTESLKLSFESGVPIAAVSKIINSHLPPDRWDSSQWI